MTKLYIDTSNNNEVVVALEKDGETFKKKITLQLHSAQKVLPLIDELLVHTETKMSDITEVSVETGPGSFTGLRVGIAIANTLGKVLQIPINGNKVGVTVEPVYE